MRSEMRSDLGSHIRYDTPTDIRRALLRLTAPALVLVATLVAVVAVADDRGPKTLTWTDLPAHAIHVYEERGHRRTHYCVQLPEGHTARAVELRFASSLAGAKVDAWASGPSGQVTLLHERRMRGGIVAVTLPPLALGYVEVVVHHHLRPPPLLRLARVAREVSR
jgi:hypothetical protein